MSNQPDIQLCPAQKSAFNHLSASLQVGSIVRLWGGVGRGKTTILKELHKQVGGAKTRRRCQRGFKVADLCLRSEALLVLRDFASVLSS